MTAFPNAHQPDPNSTPVDGSMMAGMTGRTTNISVPPQPQGAYAIPGSPAPVPPGGQPATIIPETTQGTATHAPPQDQIDDALAFLREEGVPDNVLSGLDQGALVEWASTEAAKGQDEDGGAADAVTDILTRLEARLQTPAGEAQPKSESTVPGMAYLDETGDMDPNVQALMQQTAQQQRQIQFLSSLMESRVINEWKERSKEEFPIIATDQAVEDKITKLAGILINSGEYTSIDRALDAATTLTVQSGKTGSGETALGRRGRLAQLRSRSSMSVPAETVSTTSATGLSAEQVRERQLQLITSGKSAEAQELADSFARENAVQFSDIV